MGKHRYTWRLRYRAYVAFRFRKARSSGGRLDRLVDRIAVRSVTVRFYSRHGWAASGGLVNRSPNGDPKGSKI